MVFRCMLPGKVVSNDVGVGFRAARQSTMLTWPRVDHDVFEDKITTLASKLDHDNPFF